MIFEWEGQQERLKRFIRIPAKRKLEWLRRMNEFIRRASTKKQQGIYRKMRQTWE